MIPKIMALPPQKFREIVLQMLFAQDFAPVDVEEAIPFWMEEHKTTKKSTTEAYHKLERILTHLPEIDTIIRPVSINFSFERIGKVERSVLRLAVHELLEQRLPKAIVLAEAIRLCRKFGSPESAHFVNAILDEINVSGDATTIQPTIE